MTIIQRSTSWPTGTWPIAGSAVVHHDGRTGTVLTVDATGQAKVDFGGTTQDVPLADLSIDKTKRPGVFDPSGTYIDPVAVDTHPAMKWTANLRTLRIRRSEVVAGQRDWKTWEAEHPYVAKPRTKKEVTAPASKVKAKADESLGAKKAIAAKKVVKAPKVVATVAKVTPKVSAKQQATDKAFAAKKAAAFKPHMVKQKDLKPGDKVEDSGFKYTVHHVDPREQNNGLIKVHTTEFKGAAVDADAEYKVNVVGHDAKVAAEASSQPQSTFDKLTDKEKDKEAVDRWSSTFRHTGNGSIQDDFEAELKNSETGKKGAGQTDAAQAAQHVLSRVANSPLLNTELHRGVVLKSADVKKIKEGGDLDLPASSFSKVGNVASMFSVTHDPGKQSVVLHVAKGAHGWDISKLSGYSTEKEVISGGKFHVDRVEKYGDGTTHVFTHHTAVSARSDSTDISEILGAALQDQHAAWEAHLHGSQSVRVDTSVLDTRDWAKWKAEHPYVKKGYTKKAEESAKAHATASADAKATEASHDAGKFAEQDQEVMSKASDTASKLPIGTTITHAEKMSDEEYAQHRDHVEHELVAHGTDDLLRSPVSTHNSEDRVAGVEGKYTPEREVLHKQILDEWTKKGESVPNDHRAVILRPSMSKAQANYRPTTSTTVHCTNCKFVIEHGSAPSTCGRVIGTVDGAHVCDYWEDDGLGGKEKWLGGDYDPRLGKAAEKTVAPSTAHIPLLLNKPNPEATRIEGGVGEVRNWKEWDEEHPWEKKGHKPKWLPEQPLFGKKKGTVKESLSDALGAANVSKGKLSWTPKPPPPPKTPEELAAEQKLFDERQKLAGAYADRDLHAEGVWGKRDYRSRYGTVTFDNQGRVLLREPKNHFDGFSWTMPKGHPDSKTEHPTQVALRETEEETGLHTKIVGHVPGGFSGGTAGSVNHYYLAHDSGQAFDPTIMNGETSKLVWATPQQADLMMQEGTNLQGVHRDRTVLRAAIAAHNQAFPDSPKFPDLAPMPPPPPPPKPPKPKIAGSIKDVTQTPYKSGKTGTKWSSSTAKSEGYHGVWYPGMKLPGERSFITSFSDEMETRNWKKWREEHPYIKTGYHHEFHDDAEAHLHEKLAAEEAVKEHDAAKDMLKKIGTPEIPKAPAIEINTPHSELAERTALIDRYTDEANTISGYKADSTRGTNFVQGYVNARMSAHDASLTPVTAHDFSVQHNAVAEDMQANQARAKREGVAAGFHAHSVKYGDKLEDGKIDASASVAKPVVPPIGNLDEVKVPEPADLTPKTENDLSVLTKLTPGQKFSNGETVPATGTNGGQWYEDKNGQGYFLKGAQSDEHAENEVAGALAYEQAGVKAQDVSLVKMNDGSVRALSHYVSGIKPIMGPQDTDETTRASARAGSGMDALMSHYDLTGMVMGSGQVDGPNLFKDKDGNVVRLDLGGTGRFRAQGSAKPSWKVGGWNAGPPEENDYETIRKFDQGRLAYGVTKPGMENLPQDMEASLGRAADFDTDKYHQAMLDAGLNKKFADDQVAVIKSRQDHLHEMGYGTGSTLPASPPTVTTSISGTSVPHWIDQAAIGPVEGHSIAGNPHEPGTVEHTVYANELKKNLASAQSQFKTPEETQSEIKVQKWILHKKYQNAQQKSTAMSKIVAFTAHKEMLQEALGVAQGHDDYQGGHAVGVKTAQNMLNSGETPAAVHKSADGLGKAHNEYVHGLIDGLHAGAAEKEAEAPQPTVVTSTSGTPETKYLAGSLKYEAFQKGKSEALVASEAAGHSHTMATNTSTMYEGIAAAQPPGTSKAHNEGLAAGYAAHAANVGEAPETAEKPEPSFDEKQIINDEHAKLTTHAEYLAAKTKTNNSYTAGNLDVSDAKKNAEGWNKIASNPSLSQELKAEAYGRADAHGEVAINSGEKVNFPIGGKSLPVPDVQKTADDVKAGDVVSFTNQYNQHIDHATVKSIGFGSASGTVYFKPGLGGYDANGKPITASGIKHSTQVTIHSSERPPPHTPISSGNSPLSEVAPGTTYGVNGHTIVSNTAYGTNPSLIHAVEIHGPNGDTKTGHFGHATLSEAVAAHETVLASAPKTPTISTGSATGGAKVLAKSRLEFHAGTSNKFYESEVHQLPNGQVAHITRYGSTKPGAHVTEHTEPYATSEAATAAHHKTVQSKVAKGYKEIEPHGAPVEAEAPKSLENLGVDQSAKLTNVKTGDHFYGGYHVTTISPVGGTGYSIGMEGPHGKTGMIMSPDATIQQAINDHEAKLASQVAENAPGADESGYLSGTPEHATYMDSFNIANGTLISDVDSLKKNADMYAKSALQPQSPISKASYEGLAAGYQARIKAFLAQNEPTIATSVSGPNTPDITGIDQHSQIAIPAAINASHVMTYMNGHASGSQMGFDMAAEGKTPKQMKAKAATYYAKAKSAAPNGEEHAKALGTAHGLVATANKHQANLKAAGVTTATPSTPSVATWKSTTGGTTYVKHSNGDVEHIYPNGSKGDTVTGEMANQWEKELDEATPQHFTKTVGGVAPTVAAPTVVPKGTKTHTSVMAKNLKVGDQLLVNGHHVTVHTKHNPGINAFHVQDDQGQVDVVTALPTAKYTKLAPSHPKYVSEVKADQAAGLNAQVVGSGDSTGIVTSSGKLVAKAQPVKFTSDLESNGEPFHQHPGYFNEDYDKAYNSHKTTANPQYEDIAAADQKQQGIQAGTVEAAEAKGTFNGLQAAQMEWAQHHKSEAKQQQEKEYIAKVKGSYTSKEPFEVTDDTVTKAVPATIPHGVKPGHATTDSSVGYDQAIAQGYDQAQVEYLKGKTPEQINGAVQQYLDKAAALGTPTDEADVLGQAHIAGLAQGAGKAAVDLKKNPDEHPNASSKSIISQGVLADKTGHGAYKSVTSGNPFKENQSSTQLSFDASELSAVSTWKKSYRYSGGAFVSALDKIGQGKDPGTSDAAQKAKKIMSMYVEKAEANNQAMQRKVKSSSVPASVLQSWQQVGDEITLPLTSWSTDPNAWSGNVWLHANPGTVSLDIGRVVNYESEVETIGGGKFKVLKVVKQGAVTHIYLEQTAAIAS